MAAGGLVLWWWQASQHAQQNYTDLNVRNSGWEKYLNNLICFLRNLLMVNIRFKKKVNSCWANYYKRQYCLLRNLRTHKKPEKRAENVIYYEYVFIKTFLLFKITLSMNIVNEVNLLTASQMLKLTFKHLMYNTANYLNILWSDRRKYFVTFSNADFMDWYLKEKLMTLMQNASKQYCITRLNIF